MKLLYLHSTSTLGSTKANMIGVLLNCNAFAENGVEVSLVIPKPKNEILDVNSYVFNKYGLDIDFKIIFYKLFSISRFSKYFFTRDLKNILKNSDAEFVFVRHPNFIKLIFNCNKKVIFESHNNLMHYRSFLIDYYWKYKMLSYVKDRRFILFICISYNLKLYWKNFLKDNSKLIALHDGVYLKNFEIILDKQQSRIDLEMPLDKKIVMYVGSLFPDREIENIIALAKEFPELLFYVVGGPKNFEVYYSKMASESNIENIVFTGHQKYTLVNKYLFASDILLALWSKKVPTMNYCSPLKLFEYMASGKTIIAHDFITIREVIRHKENGYLVNPDNNSFLMDTLKHVVKCEKSEQMGINARSEVFREYSWKIRAKKIINNIPQNK